MRGQSKKFSRLLIAVGDACCGSSKACDKSLKFVINARDKSVNARDKSLKVVSNARDKNCEVCDNKSKACKNCTCNLKTVTKQFYGKFSRDKKDSKGERAWIINRGGANFLAGATLEQEIEQSARQETKSPSQAVGTHRHKEVAELVPGGNLPTLPREHPAICKHATKTSPDPRP